MARKFPLFLDISDKKIVVYGAGRIASRRVETLLAFTSSLTVFAPEASERVQRAAEEGYLVWKREAYQEGTIPADAFMVLAATNDAWVNSVDIQRRFRAADGVPVGGHPWVFAAGDEHILLGWQPQIVQRGMVGVALDDGDVQHTVEHLVQHIDVAVLKDG